MKSIIVLSLLLWSIQESQSHLGQKVNTCNYCQLLDTVKNQLNTLEEISNNLSYVLPKSCEEVYESGSCNSGYYDIQPVQGQSLNVYCNMDKLCNDSGGWMRVGYLNMSDPSAEQCLPGFSLYKENGIKACGRNETGAGCQSVEFPSHNINYTRVCGRVTGYQKGSPDGIHPSFYKSSHNDINQAYVDGVSITRGNPRQHVWTFIAGLKENEFHKNGDHECPCAPNSPVTPQSFIGNEYFCESGNPGRNKPGWINKMYTDDPLWDGKQCGLIEEPCCNVTGIPWFNKVLEQPTTDYIELRVCADQDIGDEDVPVGYYEIYVK